MRWSHTPFTRHPDLTCLHASIQRSAMRSACGPRLPRLLPRCGAVQSGCHLRGSLRGPCQTTCQAWRSISRSLLCNLLIRRRSSYGRLSHTSYLPKPALLWISCMPDPTVTADEAGMGMMSFSPDSRYELPPRLDRNFDLVYARSVLVSRPLVSRVARRRPYDEKPK